MPRVATSLRLHLRLALLMGCTALLLTLIPGSPAHARGGGAVAQSLLRKGLPHLRKAEGAWHLGDKALARREGRIAERLFRDALAQAPTQRVAALLAAQAATFASDVQRAHEWGKHFFRLSPQKDRDPDVHFLRAFVSLLGDDRPDRALRSLQRMYSLNPRARPVERDNLWFNALNKLGGLYLNAGKHMDAARQFATGARIARRLGNKGKERLMLANLGVAYMRSDRYIEAADVYAGLAKIQPKTALWHLRHGMALANQTQFVEAVKAYRRVLTLGVTKSDPEVREVKLRLGNCLRHLGTADPNPKRRKAYLTEARTMIEAYVKAHPDDPNGHKWLGVLLYENLELPYEALVHFERAFGLDPVCDDVLRRMVQIHQRHPAPKDRDPAMWKKKAAAMAKDLKEGAERREKERDARQKKTGTTGCS